MAVMARRAFLLWGVSVWYNWLVSAADVCNLILPPEQRLPGYWIENWNGWEFVRDDGPETDGSRPRRAGFVYGGGRMHHCWHDDGEVVSHVRDRLPAGG